MSDQKEKRKNAIRRFVAPSYRNSLFSLIFLCVIVMLGLILRLFTPAQASGVARTQAQPQPTSGNINQTIDWTRQFGSSQRDAIHNDFDRNGDMTISGGNIYVVGNTEGTVDPQNPIQGVTDVWLAKYNTAGQQHWIRQLGTSDEDRVSEVVINSSGEIFIGGYTMGSFPSNMNRGNYDLWVAKYDSSGALQWVSQDGTSGQDGKFGLVITPDASGGGKVTTFSADRGHVSTYSFNSGGVFSSVNGLILPQQARNTPYDLALGPDNSIYVVGEFTNSYANPPIKNRYVIKYDNRGNQIDIDFRMTGVDESARRVAVDAEGVVYVAGVTRAGDAWVTRYNANGSPAWTRTLGSLGEDVINAIEVNGARGYLVVAGMTKGTLGEVNLDNRDDAWFARLRSSDGVPTLLRQFPKTGEDGFNALAIGGCDNLILTGYTKNFVRPIGAEDAFLMRFAYPNGSGLIQPVVSSFAPNSGRAGDQVAISYGNLFGVTGVYFNGVPATILNWFPNNTIIVRVPPGATTGPVTITTNCNHASSANPFTVLP